MLQNMGGKQGELNLLGINFFFLIAIESSDLQTELSSGTLPSDKYRNSGCGVSIRFHPVISVP